MKYFSEIDWRISPTRGIFRALSSGLKEVKQLLSKAPGVKVVDNAKNKLYPMPIDASKRDEVFVGRIREDESIPNGINMWIVSDNLRKGAALNAVQIAEILIKEYL